jgi:hypothetical protein
MKYDLLVDFTYHEGGIHTRPIKTGIIVPSDYEGASNMWTVRVDFGEGGVLEPGDTQEARLSFLVTGPEKHRAIEVGTSIHLYAGTEHFGTAVVKEILDLWLD